MDEPKITLEDISSETWIGEARYKALRRFAVEVAAIERQRCKAVLRALIDAGNRDGRYLAICQQDEWAAAVARAEEFLGA